MHSRGVQAAWDLPGGSGPPRARALRRGSATSFVCDHFGQLCGSSVTCPCDSFIHWSTPVRWSDVHALPGFLFKVDPLLDEGGCVFGDKTFQGSQQ